MTPAAGRPASRAAGAAALATLVLATLNAFPALPPLDAGDFVAAASTLGVPHATGFPLYTQAANAALSAVPIGSVPFRVSLISALCAALAAGGVTWTFVRAAGLRAGAALVALCTAAVFSRVDTLVLHARVPEVYALNLAAIGAALVCLERWRATQDARWRALLALVAGVGLANHALFRLWLPLLLLAALSSAEWRALRERRLREFVKPWGPLLALGALALASYAYLYVAALRDPPHNWGDPSTLERLWAHVTARDIRLAYADDMIPGAYALQVHAARFAEQLWNGLGLHVLIAILGFGVLLLRARVLGAWIIALVGLEAAYAVAINPMGLRDYQNGQLVALALAAAAGVALGALVDRLALDGSVLRTRALLSASAVLVALVFMAAPGPRVSSSGSDWSSDDIMALHAGLALPESITVTGSDTTTAAALHAQVTLDARPDSAWVGRHILSEGGGAHRAARRSPIAWAPREVIAAWAGEGVGGGPAREHALLDFAAAHGHAVYWEGTGTGDDLPPDYSLEHVWPIGTVRGVGSPALQAAPSDGRAAECAAGSRSYCVEGLDVAFGAAGRARAGAEDYFYGRWIGRQWGYRGARAFRAGDFDGAGVWFARAQRRAPDNSAWTTGLALSLANTGRLEEGLAVQELALAQNPLSVQALRNAIAFAEALGAGAAVERYRAQLARVEGR